MGNITLPDVALCAIVRDEMENPSGQNPPGAIVDFVESTVPHVEEAIIVDTGSVDGTRDVLSDLEKQYDNLQVHDHEFNGFGQSRNVALDLVGTKFALILDADERLTTKDFWAVKEQMILQDSAGYNFGLIDVLPEGVRDHSNLLHNPRLFLNHFRYSTELPYGETLMRKGLTTVDIPVSIKHFHSGEWNRTSLKIDHWYNPVVLKGGKTAPSQIPELVTLWKYNPSRENYR